MRTTWFKFCLLVLFTTFGSVSKSNAQNDREHLEVALRTIGHQLLLNANDSTSLVLPIKTEREKFVINFASSFSFKPSFLMSTIDSIFGIANIGENYRLEVEDIDNNEVVYSYEAAPADSGLSTCSGREYPEGNYSVLVTILDDEGWPIVFKSESEKIDENHVKQKTSSSNGLVSILISVAILAVIDRKSVV